MHSKRKRDFKWDTIVIFQTLLLENYDLRVVKLINKYAKVFNHSLCHVTFLPADNDNMIRR